MTSPGERLDNADAAMAHLNPEIKTALEQADALRRGVKPNQALLGFLRAAKEAAVGSDGEIDLVALKASINATITLLQSYHDEL